MTEGPTRVWPVGCVFISATPSPLSLSRLPTSPTSSVASPVATSSCTYRLFVQHSVLTRRAARGTTAAMSAPGSHRDGRRRDESSGRGRKDRNDDADARSALNVDPSLVSAILVGLRFFLSVIVALAAGVVSVASAAGGENLFLMPSGPPCDNTRRSARSPCRRVGGVRLSSPRPSSPAPPCDPLAVLPDPPSVQQDSHRQRRWYTVTRGRSVGVFSNW